MRSPPRDHLNKPTSACHNCRKKKVKCTGGAPCQHCSKRGLRCVVPEADQRRLYSASKIADLERRLAQYENHSERDGRSSQGQAVTEVFTEPPLSVVGVHDRMTGLEGEQRPDVAVYNPVYKPAETSACPPRPRSPSLTAPTAQERPGNDGQSYSSPVSTIAADSLLSTSNVFGARVNDLLNQAPQSRPYRQDIHSTAVRSDASLNAQQQPVPPTMPHTSSPLAPPLPCEAEASRCLKILNVQIGRTQHHIDFRDFSDQLAYIYSEEGAASRFATPWYLEVYLVCAIAKLFTGEFGGRSECLPGIDYFNYVHRSLPNLSDLHSYLRLGIELLALVAVYLQNVNRKDEAYVYISTALRLAISHGLHRAGAAESYSRSERVHLNRLWWTVYMQERRLAAATGNPPSINDESITAALPIDAYGFASVAPLLTNIKIARITGRIIKTLYGSGRQEESEFIPNVQEIVRNLHEIALEIPPVPEPQNVSDDVALKDSATLHLALYQALILTVRPIMLHVAQLILRDRSLNGHDLNISSLGRLSRTCSEAATRLLRVLTALRQRQMIGIFGFWDFDGIHCAAFIMVLAAIYDSACKEDQKINPTPAILSAFELMQYLIDRGNFSVVPKLQELQKTWNRLETYLRRKNQLSSSTTPEPQLSRLGSSSGLDQGLGHTDGVQNQRGVIDRLQDNHAAYVPCPMNGTHDLQQGPAQRQDNAMVTDLWSEISHLCFPLNTDESATMAGLSIDEYYNCTSLYNSPGWAYIGEESGNFAELERHMVNTNPP